MWCVLKTAQDMKVSVNLLLPMVLTSHSLEVALGSVQQLCSSELKSQSDGRGCERERESSLLSLCCAL